MSASGWGQGDEGAANGTTIEVIVADDHELVRQGLRQIMEEEPDMEVTGEAGSIASLVEMLEEGDWHVLLLDISLPDGSGLDALEEIREMRPQMPVLMLSMHADGHYARQALERGASGYVTKSGAADEVAAAVRMVVRGRVYLSEPLARELAGEQGQDRRS